MSQTESNQGVCFRKEEREPSWETDLLGRKDAAHQLERLIANAPGPYVIAMTSEWGSGKTFFLKAWEKDLLARKRPCVYFNAWETDHAGDPLLALTGCITHSLKKQNLIKPKRLKNFATSASKIVSQAPGTFSKILVGIANHYTDGEFEEVKEIVSDTMKLGTDLFLKNNARRKGFTKQLEAIAKEASDNALNQPADPVNGTNHFPLFVMIDELDRCRPSYVIELLENIKHLFGVRGVVFLLAIDQDQILGVIQHTFGLCDTNGRDIRLNYLRKFIDIFWALPTPDPRVFVLQNLLTRRPALPQGWPVRTTSDPLKPHNDNPLATPDSYYYTLASAAIGKQRSLRELLQILEKFFTISTCYNMNTRESFVIFDILMNYIDKIKNQDMSRVIKQSEFSPQSAAQRDERDIADQDHFSTLYAFIIENSYTQTLPQIKPSTQTIGNRYVLSLNERIMSVYLANIFTRFSGEELTQSVTKKIAFLDEFHFGE